MTREAEEHPRRRVEKACNGQDEFVGEVEEGLVRRATAVLFLGCFALANITLFSP